MTVLREDLAGSVDVSGPWPVGASAHSMGFADCLPSETLEACESADAVLLGAIGKHPGVSEDVCPRPELALLTLREVLDFRLSIREITMPAGDRVMVVRNLLGGSYSPNPEGSTDHIARDLFVLDAWRVEEVVRAASRFIGPGVVAVSAHKSSVLATSRLWQSVVGRVAAECQVELQSLLVDRAAYEITKGYALPGVIIAEGLLGDILSDMVTARAGSPALCSSASINPDAADNADLCAGLFEPAHGSAPRIAGQSRANPMGGFLALAQLLGHFASTRASSVALRQAIREALAFGPHTYDLSPSGVDPATTEEVAGSVIGRFRDTRVQDSPAS